MAKNLDRATTNSTCCGNNADNCAKYGRLYNWNDAKSACPAGWHLPSDAEWTTLTDYVGGASTAGMKLKSTSGWHNNGNGTDDYGFSALPGGLGLGDGRSGGNIEGGYWWSVTAKDYAGYAIRVRMNYDTEGVVSANTSVTNQFSVRCVQDD
jgi:uncharacterized protein (TIGR02145 family)